MATVTPFGLMIRRLRLEKHQKLGDMAKDLSVSSSYLSAIEHGLKPINETRVKKISLYFNNDHVPLDEWKRLADDSQPQMTLDLETDRELKLAFGRTVDSLPDGTKKQLLEMLADDDSCSY